MKRNEAVTFLREITKNCNQMSPEAVTLIDSPVNDPLSIGYQVHIKTILDNETKGQIQNLLQERSLAFIEEANKVIIYKPKPATENITVL
ncbi:MAG: hypothetical protein LBH74_07480 [Nitrososphaerota archaeon]|uniref:hypothetical protein n=1 Tax=Candidatus Bathycorpusculum sp. TaxID=2994959 RepID=UPI002819C984|nr:hypothetical protein [Candidatus Termitimicrobium sp.]MCL2432021.1 hypothetical protein [Candidatus Termitimicrobium sp.]MDR0493460.1 hypothetical protein [Nitrososphaerota archaeon]